MFAASVATNVNLSDFLVMYFCCLRTKLIVSFSLITQSKKYQELFSSPSLYLLIWKSKKLISVEQDFSSTLKSFRNINSIDFVL